jgi:hypothetical protein
MNKPKKLNDAELEALYQQAETAIKVLKKTFKKEKKERQKLK